MTVPALLQKFLTDEIMAMSDVKAEHETQMKAQKAVFPADNPVRVTRNPTERPLPL